MKLIEAVAVALLACFAFAGGQETETSTESSTESTTSTESSTTVTPNPTILKPYIVVLYKVEMLAETTSVATETTTHDHGSRGLTGHTFTPMCSGALITDTAVLTTVTCTTMATSLSEMSIFVSTAKYSSSVDNAVKEYFEVQRVQVHPSFDQPPGALNDNLAVLTLKAAVTLSSKVAVIPLAGEGPEVDTSCEGTFWLTTVPFTQTTSILRTSACAAEVGDGYICAGATTTSQACASGQEGALLTTNSQLAAILSTTLTADCQTGPLPYYDVTKQLDWINAALSSATLMSRPSFLVLVLIMTILLMLKVSFN